MRGAAAAPALGPLLSVLALAGAARADGVRVDATPRALFPLGEDADPGFGAGLRLGWRFDLDQFQVVPEAAATWGALPTDGDGLQTLVAAGGLRLVLHQPPVQTSLHLHVGHGRLSLDDAESDGLALEAGGALAWTSGVWSAGLEAAQVQVFTDPGGALGRADRRWLALGLVVAFTP